MVPQSLRVQADRIGELWVAVDVRWLRSDFLQGPWHLAAARASWQWNSALEV